MEMILTATPSDSNLKRLFDRVRDLVRLKHYSSRRRGP